MKRWSRVGEKYANVNFHKCPEIRTKCSLRRLCRVFVFINYSRTMLLRGENLFDLCAIVWKNCIERVVARKNATVFIQCFPLDEARVDGNY